MPFEFKESVDPTLVLAQEEDETNLNLSLLERLGLNALHCLMLLGITREETVEEEAQYLVAKRKRLGL